MPAKTVVKVIYQYMLTKYNRKQVVDAVDLINYKKDGRIKGRTCDNGIMQKHF